MQGLSIKVSGTWNCSQHAVNRQIMRPKRKVQNEIQCGRREIVMICLSDFWFYGITRNHLGTSPGATVELVIPEGTMLPRYYITTPSDQECRFYTPPELANRTSRLIRKQ